MTKRDTSNVQTRFDPVARAIAAEDEARFRTALLELDARSRVVVFLHAAGWSWEDVARVIRVRPEGARSCWKRAIAALRKDLLADS